MYIDIIRKNRYFITAGHFCQIRVFLLCDTVLVQLFINENIYISKKFLRNDS